MPERDPDDNLLLIFDRIAAGTHTEADLATLRRGLLVGGQGKVIQIGKYNVYIGEGHDSASVTRFTRTQSRSNQGRAPRSAGRSRLAATFRCSLSGSAPAPAFCSSPRSDRCHQGAVA